MKKFIKNVENFSCFNCKSEITGGGYTNHCPNCLWSLHVDINPGDRANSCKGKMQPTALRKHKKGIQIVHKCMSCKIIKNNIVQKNDKQEEIIKLKFI